MSTGPHHPADENPYQPPVSSFTDKALPQLQHALEFSGELTRSDVNLALRDRKSLIVPIGILAVASVPLLAVLALILLNSVGALGGGEGIATLAWLGALLAPAWLLVLFQLRSRLFPAIAFLKKHPFALGQVQGTLSTTDLTLHSERGIAWLPLTSLTQIDCRADELVLQFDPHGVTTLILPMRFFEDPVTAQQIFLFYAGKNPRVPVGVVDERKLRPPGPSMVGSPSDDAIHFSGVLTAADIRPTPLAAQHRSLRIRFALLVVFFITVPILVAIYVDAFFAVVALVFLGILSYRIFRAYLVGLKPLSDGRQPLINMTGWIDDQGITVQNALKQGCSYWNCFVSGGGNEQALWLRLAGNMNLYVVLPRHCFASLEDFHAARRRLARSSPFPHSVVDNPQHNPAAYPDDRKQSGGHNMASK
ncbi:hypothetical protein [Roseimaritima ulvae]|uniref:Uncharacterized protein n=1 Tax=Roseimaritima ulvae TaxID=980254 RepID=A0A5B9QPL7_9BACT|nr:hypothetical protein [Roseimaritima ulvae]QEG39869.1 hypothetical protein UC8_18680 [Roseimaritima ulvae]